MLKLFPPSTGAGERPHGRLRAWATAAATALSVLLILAGGGCEPASRSTIVSPDENENGIRDDVDTYIDEKYDGEEEQAVRQLAVAITEKTALAAEGRSEEKILSSARESFDAIDCIHNRMEDIQAAHNAVLETRAQILNTYRRSEAAEKASAVLGGHVFEGAERGEKVCKQPEDLF